MIGLAIVLAFAVACNAAVTEFGYNGTVYTYDQEALDARKPEYSVHPIILSRTSPHENLDVEVPDAELFSVLEAAKWAPSASNLQPWIFVYTKKGTTEYTNLFNLLATSNQKYVKGAGAIVAVISAHGVNGTGNSYATFDTGAASILLHLEGSARGFNVHTYAGFDIPKSYDVLHVPKDGSYKVEVLMTVGKRPPVAQRTVKENIHQRKTLNEVIQKGVFVVPKNN